jgi:HK97 family phage portal protein
VSFWSRIFATGADVTPNDNPQGVPPASVATPDYTPGDPDGVVISGDDTYSRSLRLPLPSPWSGWPAEWNTPAWDFGSRFNELVDIAWACLDLNASVLSTMPVYRTRNGQVIEPSTWMANPDPTIYSSWNEFAKQLFWDYMLGEAFVLPVATGRDGYPLTFRVIPPWMMWVELRGGVRQYRLGGEQGPDITDEVLHIRYKSTTDSPRGVGPLESAGGRMLTAGVLAQYVRETVKTGGVPQYTLETEQPLNATKAAELRDAWVTARITYPGQPPVLDSGIELKTHHAMSPRDMAMLEISQFTEARIAILLGVPPFLVGLPSGGDSMTYSNVSSLFDFHDRASLRPKALAVMAAMSDWALPRPQKVELNRDEYSRPSFEARAESWVKLKEAGIVSVEEIRAAERLMGEVPARPQMAIQEVLP